MSRTWRQWSDRWAALSMREKALVVLATLGGMIYLAYSYGIEPYVKREKRAQATRAESQTLATNLRREIETLKTRAADPDAPNRARLAELRGKLATLDQSLQDLQRGLVPPDRMASVLESILVRDARLKLVALRTLPAATLIEAKKTEVASPAAKPDAKPEPQAPAAVPPEQNIYRHGVELTIEGSYADLLAYLARMETQPWRVFWGRAALDANRYPVATLTLTVYTLSLNRAWLAV